MMPNGRVLVIAGSDSSGGAGLEADQKVLAAHGCYAMTATTALTAQNTQGVYDIHHVPPVFLRKQIDACFDDIGVDVVKTGTPSVIESCSHIFHSSAAGVVSGVLLMIKWWSIQILKRASPKTKGMLASVETIKAVAEALEAHGVASKTLVVDPVMVATTGAKLLPTEAVAELIAHILPQTTVLTPNIPEACLLLSSAADSDGQKAPSRIRTVGDLEEVAKGLLKLGPRWVLLKGGHTPFNADYVAAEDSDQRCLVVDILVGPDRRTRRFEAAYQDSRNTHGTGCSLASAVAANLAQGMEVQRAVKAACRYVEAAIKTAPGFGRGNGPLNHFHSLSVQPFAPGRFVEYILDLPTVAPVWNEFTHHPFVMALGEGSLPLESFKGYLVQDYLYLIQFARANALASYKSSTMADISAAAAIVLHIERETKLHLEYCEGFGLTREEMEKTEEHVACTAYSRYILDVGQSSDWLGLQLALAPCLLGYGAIAQRLYEDSRSKREGNAYWTWINNYVAADYVQAVKTGSALMERHAVRQSPSRIEELVKIFVHATKMEIAFWEMFPASSMS